jgi:hypothetical protein
MEKLVKEFEIIFKKHKDEWLSFYDDNPSYISKMNNLSFFKEKNNEYRKEIIYKSIEYKDIDKTKRESLEFEYFIMFNQYQPLE